MQPEGEQAASDIPASDAELKRAASAQKENCYAEDEKTVLTLGNGEGAPQDKTVPSMHGSAGGLESSVVGQEYRNSVFAEKYEILEKLGAGGISTVYKAKHKVLDRIYALKLLHDVKQDSIMRFQQEAKAATLLNHPNLVGVVDFGISEGVPYMVMDFVDGVTFGNYVRKQKPGTADLSRLCSEVCLALAHAHEKGVVHRDIKPSNIMISTDSEGVAHAVVVDFGIAKILDDKSNESHNLTRTGDVFGTPLYMSPEQCQGSAIVDARSDIYSFGCVMYEFIAGKPPFQGYNSYQIIHQHIASAPPAFSSELRKSKDLSRMEGIILKAMAKDPSDRYQYMLQMSSALKEIELESNRSDFDPLFGFRMAVTRLKASDKESAFRSAGLQVCTLLASAIACILFFLPPQMALTEQTIERESKIIAKTKELFGNAVTSDQNIFHLRPGTKKNILKELRELCSYDRQTRKSCRVLIEKSLLAIDKLDGIMKFKKEMISEGMGLDLISSMGKMEAHLTKGMTLWCQANAEAVDLANAVSGKREINRNKLVLMNFVFYLSFALSLPLMVIMLLALRLFFVQTQKEKTEKSGRGG